MNRLKCKNINYIYLKQYCSAKYLEPRKVHNKEFNDLYRSSVGVGRGLRWEIQEKDTEFQ
jgi:hypothetical protein